MVDGGWYCSGKKFRDADVEMHAVRNIAIEDQSVVVRPNHPVQQGVSLTIDDNLLSSSYCQ